MDFTQPSPHLRRAFPAIAAIACILACLLLASPEQVLAAEPATATATLTVADSAAPHSHKWGNWTVKKKPTCTEAGLEYRVCSDCGNREERAVPKLGHKWKPDASESEDATFASKGIYTEYCVRCNEERDRATPKKKMTARDKEATKAIKDLYRYARKYDSSRMLSCFKERPKSGIWTRGTYARDVIRAQNAKLLECRILDGRAGAKKATYTVGVTYRSGYDAFCKGFAKSQRRSENYVYRYYRMPSDSWITSNLWNSVREAVKSVGFHRTSREFGINLVKDGGKWKIAKKSLALIDSINCDYQSASNDSWD